MRYRRTKAEMNQIFTVGMINIIKDLRKWWPLTVRQVYYRMVAAQLISNNKNEYQAVGKKLTAHRINRRVPWRAIADNTRSISSVHKHNDVDAFIRAEAMHFLDGYQRCLMQQQDCFIEVWTEKDALAEIFRRTVLPYCISVVVCKGHISTTFIHNYVTRAKANKNKKPVIIYGGDLDPSGLAIPRSIKSRIRSSGVDVKLHRFALKPKHVDKYSLPYSIDAIKKTDTNYPRYVEKYGDMAVELDALEPEILQKLIRKALRRYVDDSTQQEERRIYTKELDRIADLKGKVLDFISDETGIESI